MKIGCSFGIVFLVSLTLSACGGGGGGSGAEPASLVEPEPTPEEQNTGIFTDAPVSGLRYTQGSFIGYTENGEFKFNPNRSDPVCFYIGNILLGCVQGADVVTPYDLSALGRPASLQAGYNISRLLISLDQDPGENILLSDATQQAQGVLDFMVADGVFATDDLVSELINKYAPEGTLVSKEDVDAHIADNEAVQEAIEDLRHSLDTSIAKMEVTWDNTLMQPGILAHIKGWAEGASVPTEHMYLELDGEAGDLHLAKITYVNVDGSHTSFNVGADGVPRRTFQDKQAYEFANLSESSFEDWVVTSSYRPRQSAFLLPKEGSGSRNEARYIQQGKSAELVELIASISAAEFAEDSMLRVAAISASMINSARCAGTVQDNCGSPMEEALVLALGDMNYRQSLLTWEESALDYDICLPADVGLEIQDQECQFAPNLSQFNVVVAQGYEELGKQPMTVTHEFDARDFEGVAQFLIVEVDGYVRMYGEICDFEPRVMDLKDGTYYLSARVMDDVCVPTLETPDPGEYCYLDGEQISCDGVPHPADLESRKQFADKIFNQYVKNGIGWRFVYDRNLSDVREVYVWDEIEPHHEDWSWYEAIADISRVSNAEYYFDMFAPVLLTTYGSRAYDTFGRNDAYADFVLRRDSDISALSWVDGVYRNKDGLKIDLVIRASLRLTLQ
ncbi:MAG: hypothetical protein CMK89_23715 [Pseudomonadales bacterium]|nr:hypothetical protein [Pseudomonadales bacterium]